METDFNKIFTARSAAQRWQAALPGTDGDGPRGGCAGGHRVRRGAVPRAGAGTAISGTMCAGEHPNRSPEPSEPPGCGGNLQEERRGTQQEHAMSTLLCFGASMAPGNKDLEFLIDSEKVALVFKVLLL